MVVVVVILTFVITSTRYTAVTLCTHAYLGLVPPESSTTRKNMARPMIWEEGIIPGISLLSHEKIAI